MCVCVCIPGRDPGQACRGCRRAHGNLVQPLPPGPPETCHIITPMSHYHTHGKLAQQSPPGPPAAG